jgi:threonine dehydrogenase-like Zn-dependent dehydrogenase
MFGAGDIRIESIPDSGLIEPTDALEPGRVFDRTVRLDEVPDGYRAMNDRETIKVMIEP